MKRKPYKPKSKDLQKLKLHLKKIEELRNGSTNEWKARTL